MSSQRKDLFFGELAVQRGLVTEAQIEIALRVQKDEMRKGDSYFLTAP